MALSNAFDSSTPAGSDDPKAGDNRIRELKNAIVEREGQDHYWPVSGTTYDDNDTGFHSKVTLLEQSAAPASKANAGRLYAKDDGGDTELYYLDDSGNEIQLTEDGVLKESGNVFVTGDLLLSSVTTAHSGWTNVTSTYASKHIRIGDTVLGTGGSATLSGSSGSTTLTAAQSGLVAHTHTYAKKSSGAIGSSSPALSADTTANTNPGTTDSTGGASASSGHTHSLTSVANTPLYVDVRMWKKN